MLPSSNRGCARGRAERPSSLPRIVALALLCLAAPVRAEAPATKPAGGPAAGPATGAAPGPAAPRYTLR